MKRDYAYYYQQFKNKSTEELESIMFQIDMIDHWTTEDSAAHGAAFSILLDRREQTFKPVESKYKIVKAHRPNAEQTYPKSWNSRLAGKTIHFNLKQG